MSALPPLSPQQATAIFETLGRLQTEQDKKLVIYSTHIELESDSSALRTASALTVSASSTVWYYLGYPDNPASRELKDLPPLMIRAQQTFKDPDFKTDDIEDNRASLASAGKALAGLSSLLPKYIEDSVKTGFIEAAKKSVKATITLLKERTGHSLFVGQEDQKQVIADLHRQIATLTQRVEDQQRTIGIYDRMLGEKGTEIAGLKATIIEEVWSDAGDMHDVPTHVLIGRLHVLTGVLIARQDKT